MKMKTMKLVISAVMVTVLAACGMGEPTAKEVIQQAAESADNVNSFAMDVNLKQSIESGGKHMDINTSAKMELTKDPIAMHASLNLETKTLPVNGEFEMYMTEKGMFMENPVNGQWMKLPNKMFDQLMSMPKQKTDPLKQLKQLEAFAEDFSLTTKDDNHYVLTLSASGEKFLQFVKEQMNQSPAKTMDPKELDNIKLNKIKYTFILDKETYFPQSMKMKMDMEITNDQGSTVHIVQTADGTYSKYNEIDKITVPDEVLKNAKALPGSLQNNTQ